MKEGTLINIVIPMAGMGSRFSTAGYDRPKPFIDVNGKPMIERVLENLAYEGARYILIAQSKHIQQECKLVSELQNKYNVVFISINEITEGTACTVLFARELVNNETPLIIANSDQIVDIDFKDFVDRGLDRNIDGSIMTFIDNSGDKKWSYAKVDNDQMVSKVKEKEPISQYATVGVYMFNSGSIFIDGAIDMIINNDRVNGEFYTCPVYNYSIRSGKKIGIYNINPMLMHGIGTPEDLNSYLSLI